MANQTKVSSGGLGFMSILALIFITLKLTSVITWSWWLVLLPMWGPIALLLFILLILVIISASIG